MGKLIIISDIGGSIDTGTPEEREQLWKVINYYSNCIGSSENIICLSTISPLRDLKIRKELFLRDVPKKVVNPKIGRQFASDGYFEVDEDDNEILEVIYPELTFNKAKSMVKYIWEESLKDEILGVVFLDDDPGINLTDGYVEKNIGNIPYYCIHLESNLQSDNPNYIHVKSGGVKGMCEGLAIVATSTYVPYIEKTPEEVCSLEDTIPIFEFSAEEKEKPNIFSLIRNKFKRNNKN